jgi:ferric-dicitrate binding protein FerR (iron transport regulator)
MTESNKTDCVELNRLLELAEGGADDERESIEKHLAACETCKANADDVQRLLATLGLWPDITPSDDFRQTVLAAAHAERPAAKEKSGSGVHARVERRRASRTSLTTVFVRVLVAAACVAVAIGLYLRYAPGPDEGAADVRAALVTWEGDMTVLREGCVVKSMPQMDLRLGDVLRTGVDAHAIVSYNDEDTSMVLRGRSEVSLREEQGGKRVFISDGTVSLTVAPQPEGRSLIVESDKAYVKVLGTRFTVAVDDDAGSVRLNVDHGTVQLTRAADGATLELVARQSAMVAEGTVFKVTGPGAVPDEKITNLLPDGGFENLRGNEFPGWTRQDDPGLRLFADTTVRRSGRSSVRMEGFPAPEENQVRVIFEDLRIKPHTTYRVRFWLKTEGLKAKWGNVGVKVIANEEYLVDYIGRMGGSFEPTQDWKHYEFTFNSGKHTLVFVPVGVWGGETGRAWFDDVALFEVSR